MSSASLDTPLGPLTVFSTNGCIDKVGWGRGPEGLVSPEISEALRQLEAYFEGRLSEFDLPICVNGSAFQKTVCDLMLSIPFGETRTYGEIAKELNSPAQAVGGACGGNPIPVIIPCHRVLGASGLGGYSGAGGVETKVWLLRHEGAGGLLI